MALSILGDRFRYPSVAFGFGIWLQNIHLTSFQNVGIVTHYRKIGYNMDILYLKFALISVTENSYCSMKV